MVNYILIPVNNYFKFGGSSMTWEEDQEKLKEEQREGKTKTLREQIEESAQAKWRKGGTRSEAYKEAITAKLVIEAGYDKSEPGTVGDIADRWIHLHGIDNKTYKQWEEDHKKEKEIEEDEKRRRIGNA